VGENSVVTAVQGCGERLILTRRITQARAPTQRWQKRARPMSTAPAHLVPWP